MSRSSFNPKSLLNLKHQKADRLDRQPLVDRLQFRITPAVSKRLSLIPASRRNDLLRQWVEDGLDSYTDSGASGLASDLIGELNRATTEIPELSGLLDLCNGSVEEAVAVIRLAVRVDYHHPIDWVNELARTQALLAAYRLGCQRRADEVVPRA